MIMSAGRSVESAGCVTWWGFGPARDLLSAHGMRPKGELNVLVVGSGDPRHILKTISSLRDTDKLHVWVIENSMDVVARQMLLLYLALVSPKHMSLREKTEVYLEVFGNSEIRSQTEEVLKHAAAQLTLSVTSTPDMHTDWHTCLDTSLLKFKERDELAWIFGQWQHPPSFPTSVRKAWDARIRQHLGTRYDARLGCFDWDLTMKLHNKGAGVIHKLHYVKWRERGVAFEMREGLYETANQSLLSVRVFSHKGQKVCVRGYWGDIVSSPYLCFGIETDKKELLKTQNNQQVKTAQDISVANVQDLFESLTTRGRQSYESQVGCETSPSARMAETQAQSVFSVSDEMKLSEQNQDSTARKSPEAEPQVTNEEQELKQQADCGFHYLELMHLTGVRVSFLSLDSLSKLSLKNKYKSLFNTVYCAASMVHHLDSSLKQMAAPGAVLMVELVKYLLDLSKEQESTFAVTVAKIVKDLGFEPTQDQNNDAYAIFTLQED